MEHTHTTELTELKGQNFFFKQKYVQPFSTQQPYLAAALSKAISPPGIAAPRW